MITREEFNRLLNAYVVAWGDAYAASDRRPADYQAALNRAAEARQALQRAVFGDDAL